jgi:SprT protein
MVDRKFFDFLEKHVPENAVHYCFDLWKEHPFSFKITRKRITKNGDYRYEPAIEHHTITVNGTLSKYAFLITYIHEVAHQHVQLQRAKGRRRVSPHGEEWKSTFQQLMLPLLNNLVFPDPLLKVLSKHMQNPKASTYADARLVKALQAYDVSAEGILLQELEIGASFLLKKRAFKKGELRRTRVLCEDLSTGRKYLIPKIALVTLLEGKKGDT